MRFAVYGWFFNIDFQFDTKHKKTENKSIQTNMRYLATCYWLLILSSLYTSVQAQNVPSYLPTNGLVGWWPFTGNALDSSGNGNHGTVNGGALTIDRFGQSNRAYRLNQGSSLICTNNSFNSPNSLSYSIWFRTNSPTPGQLIGFNSGRCIHGGQWDRTLSIEPLGLTFYTFAGGPQVNTASVNLVDDSWHHIVVTMNQSGSRIYIDGILKATLTAQTAGEAIVGFFRFGGLSPNDANNTLVGSYDDIGIWNRALDSNEVRQLYLSSSSGQGFVGIGTTSPAAPLHVRQDTNGETSVLIDNRSTGTSAFTSLRFNGDDGNNLIIFKNNSLRTADGGANTATIRNGAGVLRLQSSANIGLLIDNIGKVNVDDVMNLKPRSGAPTNPIKGDMYFDGVLNKLRVFDGTQWQNCW